MKIALVHDYIKEFGGAERVLEVLAEIYPEAPIYTAFCDKNSAAFEHFKNRKIITSWFQNIPFYAKLASPLRFLTPFIWRSFNLDNYDLVISSASWYITKGFKKNNSQKPVEICYCHTPPRWLYGFETSINIKKHFMVRAYSLIVGHYLRLYDFNQAQKVNYFIANSIEVKKRISKFYKKNAIVIYPPISLPLIKDYEKKDYYFIVSRITGAKGLEMAVNAAEKFGFKLKIAGSASGYYSEHNLIDTASKNIEFLGQVSDEELVKLYAQAKAFIALAREEDFGITPVESMLCGTPVIAYNGGGYKETVINNKTGVLFNEYSINSLGEAIKRFEKMKLSTKDCKSQAQKFSKERFKKEIENFVKLKSKN